MTQDAKVTKRIEPYAEVIKRCLDCSFTVPVRSKTLTDSTFREAVYREIVCQLEGIYQWSTAPVGD
jgi:hypothetical protein